MPGGPESYAPLPHDFVPKLGNDDHFRQWREHSIRKDMEVESAREVRTSDISRRRAEITRLQSELSRAEASDKSITEAENTPLSNIFKTMDDLNRWYHVERGMELPK